MTHLLVALEGILEQDGASSLDLDRLVGDLLAGLCNLVLLDGLLHQLRQRLDSLLQITTDSVLSVRAPDL